MWNGLLPTGTTGGLIFISGDGRVLKNRPEREALRSAGLHGFILAPGYLKMPVHQQASLLLWKWPEIDNIVGLLAPPSMHEDTGRQEHEAEANAAFSAGG